MNELERKVRRNYQLDLVRRIEGNPDDMLILPEKNVAFTILPDGAVLHVEIIDAKERTEEEIREFMKTNFIHPE